MERRKRLVANEVRCKAEIISVKEYLYTKHKEYEFEHHC
jgi:hypothetical protein